MEYRVRKIMHSLSIEPRLKGVVRDEKNAWGKQMIDLRTRMKSKDEEQVPGQQS